MNLNDDLARQLIKERVEARATTRRPTHPRTAKVLRRWARRLDPTD